MILYDEQSTKVANAFLGNFFVIFFFHIGLDSAINLKTYLFLVSFKLKGTYLYHKTACTSLPEDENVDVRNMSKQFN
jgi:hypothetical protein